MSIAQEFLDQIKDFDHVAALDVNTVYDDAWMNEGRRAHLPKGRIANYERRLSEAAHFIARYTKGHISRDRFIETMSTSDFSLLFGDILDRQILGEYREWVPMYRAYARIGTVPDFRTAKRYMLDGAESQLLAVKELEEYKASELIPSSYTYTIQKYGRRLPFSWETMINDELGLLQTAPRRLARAARRTEQRFASGLFISSTGPNATFFANGNKNLVNIANGAVANNPPLSITGLQDAFTVLAKQVDTDGEPIMVDGTTLVVPPALEVTARNILNATQIEVGASTDSQRLLVENWMRNRVSLVVDPYAALINTTNGSTAWYLFANANELPALEVGFLRGHEAPELFMKSPNAQRVGSGAVDPMFGDFDNDTIEYKIRHVLGGGLLNPKGAVASKGTGAV